MHGEGVVSLFMVYFLLSFVCPFSLFGEVIYACISGTWTYTASVWRINRIFSFVCLFFFAVACGSRISICKPCKKFKYLGYSRSNIDAYHLGLEFHYFGNDAGVFPFAK